MIFKEAAEEDAGDRGVIHPGHPAIKDSLVVKLGEGKLIAGTIMKTGDAAGVVRAADADLPDVILVQDIDTTDEAKSALFMKHGLAVRARLINASTGSNVVASDTLVAKLPARGLYVTQGWDESTVI